MNWAVASIIPEGATENGTGHGECRRWEGGGVKGDDGGKNI